MPARSSKRRNSGHMEPEGRSRQRDRWDKAEIIGKILTGLLPALFIAAIGLFGQQFTQSLENTRLYTELLTQREQADTALRKDMFSVLMTEFLVGTKQSSEKAASDTGTMGEAVQDPRKRLLMDIEAISNQLLKLQLLAMNFGESLTLSPLFQKLDNDLFELSERARNQGTARGRLLAQGLRKRLRGLAKVVSANQIAAIKAGGAAFTVTVPLERAGRGFVWPYDDAGQGATNSAGNEDLLPGTVKCGKITRRFEILFFEADEAREQVKVELSIQKIAGPDTEMDGGTLTYRRDPQTVEAKFHLDFFNFPLVDNTRLSDDQRFALVLTDFSEKVIQATALCFSGTYSSVRDRPFINEIVEQLSNR